MYKVIFPPVFKSGIAFCQPTITWPNAKFEPGEPAGVASKMAPPGIKEPVYFAVT